MKYDFSKCNNLQFKAKDDGGKVREGFLKLSSGGTVYLYYSNENKIFDHFLQIEFDGYYGVFTDATKFGEWAENHNLEIVPRDPETYDDWKVGDKVIGNTSNKVYTIIAVLGKAIILSKDSGISVTALTTSDDLTKYNKLLLTDYEKELIHAQEPEEKKKECPFKEGDRVLARNSDTVWWFDVMHDYKGNAIYPYECITGAYEQCIPLNEHTWKLLGTMDKYTATKNNESY